MCVSSVVVVRDCLWEIFLNFIPVSLASGCSLFLW